MIWVINHIPAKANSRLRSTDIPPTLSANVSVFSVYQLLARKHTDLRYVDRFVADDSLRTVSAVGELGRSRDGGRGAGEKLRPPRPTPHPPLSPSTDL